MKGYKFKRDATGQPVMAIGGGAWSNTYEAITVLTTATETELKCKKAQFIRTAGHLACSQEQAIVPVEIGDIIVHLYGVLPVRDENPDSQITASRITGFVNDDTGYTNIRTKPVTVTHAYLPESVIIGASTYHNRDGRYFVEQQEKPEYTPYEADVDTEPRASRMIDFLQYPGGKRP
jgi:hypothetical protein